MHVHIILQERVCRRESGDIPGGAESAFKDSVGIDIQRTPIPEPLLALVGIILRNSFMLVVAWVPIAPEPVP